MSESEKLRLQRVMNNCKLFVAKIVIYIKIWKMDGGSIYGIFLHVHTAVGVYVFMYVYTDIYTCTYLCIHVWVDIC